MVPLLAAVGWLCRLTPGAWLCRLEGHRPGSTKPLLRALCLPTYRPKEEAGVLGVFPFLGLAIWRNLATDFILLKTLFLSLLTCFDLFSCLHNASAILPIAIYQVSHPKPGGMPKTYNLI